MSRKQSKMNKQIVNLNLFGLSQVSQLHAQRSQTTSARVLYFRPVLTA